MFNFKKNVIVEFNKSKIDMVSNPIYADSDLTKKLSSMITKIINSEFMMLEHTEMLHDMVLYSLLEKTNTVQTIKSVLSCMKEYKIKSVDDISFKNGEINIKCSI